MRTKLLMAITGCLTLGSSAVAGSFFALNYFWGNKSSKGEKTEQQLLEECQKNGECKTISKWILNKGQCRVYVENSTHPTNNSQRLPYYKYTDYLHGLDDELIANKKGYEEDCRNKKDLVFKFDAENSGWLY